MSHIERLAILAALLFIIHLLRRKEAVAVAPESPEQKAIAEHLGSIETHLDETSKLRRDKRLGVKS